MIADNAEWENYDEKNVKNNKEELFYCLFSFETPEWAKREWSIYSYANTFTFFILLVMIEWSRSKMW